MFKQIFPVMLLPETCWDNPEHSEGFRTAEFCDTRHALFRAIYLGIIDNWGLLWHGQVEKLELKYQKKV